MMFGWIRKFFDIHFTVLEGTDTIVHKNPSTKQKFSTVKLFVLLKFKPKKLGGGVVA
jgi:hypothetical protein